MLTGTLNFPRVLMPGVARGYLDFDWLRKFSEFSDIHSTNTPHSRKKRRSRAQE